MGWDEALFGFILNKIRAARATPDPFQKARVRLEEVSQRLQLLGCALSGEAIVVSPAENVGGYSAHRIFLPSEIALFESDELNWKVYLYRLVYTLSSRQLGVSLPLGHENETDSRLGSLWAISKTRKYLEQELPMSAQLLRDIGRELVPQIYQNRQAQNNPLVVFFILSCGWKPPEDTEAAALSRAKLLLNQKKSVSIHDYDVLKGLATQNPDWLELLKPAFLLFGKLFEKAHGKHNTASNPPENLNLQSLSSGTEKKGVSREKVEEVKLSEKEDDENPLVHVFEKVLTADEYNAGKKNLDGSDELEDHEDALDELNLRHVIRSRDRADSIYKSDIVVDGGAPDLDDNEATLDTPFLYHEWDHSQNKYRPEWCRVYVERPEPSLPLETEGTDQVLSRHRKTVQRLQSEINKLLNERRWQNRQADGPEFDLDALITQRVDVYTRQTPQEKIYMSRRRSLQDFSATVLIDMSLSTDSWIQDKHVIQIARESLLVLSEVFKHLNIKVSIAGFYSNTRRDCRYIELKSFKDDWQTMRMRMQSVRPTGYTRIGPALRHATQELNATRSKRKMLLLISDGKPTDYDRYEGKYGIADVRKAIKEAHQLGIRVQSLAIDSQAKFYLPQMFDVGGFQILPHPDLLSQSLSKIFALCLK